jgi:cytochrome c oxidase subunit III
MAQPTPAAKDAPAPEAHAEHITSWAPIVIALSVPFLYLALLWPKVGLPIGLVIGAVGLGQWIREDMKRFQRGSFSHHEGQPGPIVGTILFIGTEVLIFGGIFAVWFVGKFHAASQGRVWGPGEHAELPILATAINTAVLVASGGTLHWGYLRLKQNDMRGFRIGLILTLILGAAFLIQQVREYLNLIGEGLTIKGSDDYGLFGSAFYMLTGTHGAHVAGGLFVLFIVLLRTLKKTQSKEHHVLLESAAIYWHFVDVVWLFLFAVVYLGWL